LIYYTPIWMYNQLGSSLSTISAQDYHLKSALLGCLYNAFVTGRRFSMITAHEMSCFPRE
jgi:hypothetical protein